MSDHERSRTAGDFYLAGTRRGEPLSHSYTVNGDEAKAMGEARRISSELGLVCETQAVRIWRGDLTPTETQSLESAVREVLAVLKPLSSRTLQHVHEVAPFYYPLVETTDGWDLSPGHPATKTLFAEVDRIYGTQLWQGLTELPFVGGQISSMARYYIEAALILAKEACWQQRKLSEPPYIHPNTALFHDVDVRRGGERIGQLDVMVIKKSLATGIDPKSPDFAQIIETLIGANDSYAVWEIKTPFRVAYHTGQNKIQSPFPRDLAETQQKVARIALWWKSEYKDDFLFPAYLRFCYLRGSQPDAIHTVILDARYFRNWSLAIEEKIIRMSEETTDDSERKANLIHLLSILYRAQEQRKEKPRTFSSAEGENLTQSTLFE